jgi:hypothetical protein
VESVAPWAGPAVECAGEGMAKSVD